MIIQLKEGCRCAMKVVCVEIIETSIPLKKTYRLSRRAGDLQETTPILVKIRTDDGIVGYGETDPWGIFTGETLGTVAAVLKEVLAPNIIGEDPTNVNNINRIQDSLVRGNLMAKSAIEMACYDLLGKSLGIPVHGILGGALYKKMPIMGGIGGGSIEEVIESAKEVINNKYRSIMIKVGRDPVHDAEGVLAARNILGKDFPIIIDANQGWDRPSAMKFINIAKEAEPVLFEQPIDADDLEGLAEIRRRCDIPISVDESLLSLRDAKEIMRLGAADVFSIKVCKHGGIKRSLEIIDLAKSKGITILFNSMIEEGITQAASLNIALTVSNPFEFGHAFSSPLRLEADITSYSSLVKDGFVQKPERPGLGVVLLEDVLEKYTLRKETVS